MAGKIKLDGTQFLEKVNNEFKITNSELKLKSTGNTIVDSSGNAVISESGGNTTISNSSIKLKSSGDSITKSDGTTAVLSESGGVVTLGNATLATSVVGSIQGYELYTLSSDITSDGDITGLTLQNSAPFTSKGSLITETAGVISFNSTGVYQILGNWGIQNNSGYDTIIIYTKITTDGSTFENKFRNQVATDSNIVFNIIPTLTIINCTDTSLVKVRFNASSVTNAQISGGGPGNNCYTQIMIMKIG